MSVSEKQLLANEQELLAQIAAGDVNSFSKLFDHYRPFVYTSSLRMTGEEMLSEEIVQDTFLKVWLNRSSLPEISNFPGWLYRIAANLTLNAIKKESLHKRTIQEWLKEIHEGNEYPGMAEDESRFRTLLNAAVAKLPSRQKQTYELIKQQGYKREEAAEILKISPETVKYHLDIALKSIRAYCMAQTDGEILGIIFCLILFS
jgi:RNA polymerase sigma-70 factor (ECF subfamily)